MPRGKKAVAADQVVSKGTVAPVIVEVEEKPQDLKVRKPYPSRQDRITLADDEITHWERLNAERRDLIEKTEKQLADRKDALAKGEAVLDRIKVKRDRLIANLDKPSTAPRAVNKQYQELIAALHATGLSSDEILSKLKQM